MIVKVQHPAPRVWAWEVRTADSARGFGGVTTTRANVRTLVRDARRALALAVALVGCTHATSARRTLPSPRPVASVSARAAMVQIDPCGTYPDMPECGSWFTPGQ